MAIDISLLQSNQTLVPFLFVLAIVFGILEITNIFENRGVKFLIALTMSIFAISNATFVAFLWSQFGNITAFFIVMFFIAFILEVFGLRSKGGHEKARTTDAMIIYGAILFIILTVGFMYVDLIPSLPIIGGGTNLLFFFTIIFILVIFWSAFKTGPSNH